MSTNHSHVIRKQILDVEVSGTESEGMALQRSLPDVCQHYLMPALERVLDRYAPTQGHLIIERLEIDAGTLTLDRLEHDLPDKIIHAVEKFFTEQLPPPGKQSEGNSSDNVQHLTEQQSIQDAFIYFLKTGSLPWSFRLPVGKTLEQAIVDSWRDAEKTEASLRFFNAIVIHTLASVNTRKRLVRQFSPDFMAALLTRFSPQAKQAMDSILAVLGGSDVPTIDINYFQRQLWETVFESVAMGNNPIDIKLVTETWHSLSVARVHLAALASLLNQHWPGAAPNTSAIQDKNSKPALSNSSIALENKQRTIDEQLETNKDLYNNLAKKTKTAKKGAPEIPVAEKKGESSTEQSGTSKFDQNDINEQLNTATDAEKIQLDSNEQIDIKDGIYINCAGVVLLHPFLPQFFGVLGIVADDTLLQPDRALCLLHFLATGQSTAPEYALILPKILCNVPLEMPVEADVSLTEAELEEASALLNTVIRYWDALGDSSIEGLRGTFLVRPGKVSVRSDGDWLLQVETMSFDILLDQLPWGIGMIKLPWMQRMLWVEWVS